MRERCISDPGYEEVNNAFERALVFLHKVRTCSHIPVDVMIIK